MSLYISVCAEFFAPIIGQLTGERVDFFWFHIANWAPSVLGLVGSIVYNKDSKVGGLLMLISGIVLLASIGIFKFYAGALSGILFLIGGIIALT